MKVIIREKKYNGCFEEKTFNKVKSIVDEYVSEILIRYWDHEKQKYVEELVDKESLIKVKINITED